MSGFGILADDLEAALDMVLRVEAVGIKCVVVSRAVGLRSHGLFRAEIAVS